MDVLRGKGVIEARLFQGFESVLSCPSRNA